MPLKDITDPGIIKFLIESYDKENRLRLNWITKNKAKIELAASLTREPTNYFDTDVMTNDMKIGMIALTRDHKSSARNRRTKYKQHIGTRKEHGHSIVDIGLGNPKEDPRLNKDDSTDQPMMRPVPPELEAVIYKPKPEDGRVMYLKKRSKFLPEKRYYFCPTTSCYYGWRLADSKLKQRPEYGRCWHLTRTLKSRVGPVPDPPHYRTGECDVGCPY